MHLIYETEQEAIDRADECGKLQNYSHWKTGNGTRWTTAPAITADGKWALDVACYQLSEEILLISNTNHHPDPIAIGSWFLALVSYNNNQAQDLYIGSD